MLHNVCLHLASKVCLPGGELEQYHVTSSSASELVEHPPSFCGLRITALSSGGWANMRLLPGL